MEDDNHHFRRKSVTFTLGEGEPLLTSKSAPLATNSAYSPNASFISTPGRRLHRTSKSYLSVSSAAKRYGGVDCGPTILEKERVWYDNYTAIDWIHDAVQDAKRAAVLRTDRSVRGQFSQKFDALQGWILALLTGICTSIVAYMVMVSEAYLFSLKDGYCHSSWMNPISTCDDFRPWSDAVGISFGINMAMACAFTLCAALLTMTTLIVFPSGKLLYMAAGSGIPEVKTILSGFIIHGFLGIHTLFVKAVGLTLAVATGLNLGKEGPFVHIASCTANILTRLFPKFRYSEAKRREALSSACAAGVAVAFGAPIGGVLFSLEEVSYYFPPKVLWRSFFCAATAAVSLKLLNPHGTGKLILLETNFEREWHVKEIPVFLLIGVFGGVYGGLFCKLNTMWSGWFRKLKPVARHPIIEVLALCILTTATSYWNIFTRMGGTDLVRALLSECTESGMAYLCPNNDAQFVTVMKTLASAIAIKMVLTMITFGARIPAGIFVPTMCIGALFGRIVGIMLHHYMSSSPNFWLFDMCTDPEKCIVPGTYAMVGAATALAGVTRMTVSLAVIMFELTGSLNYVMPFMISIMVAKWIADAFSKGIYDLLIDLNDHPYLDAKDNHHFGDAILSDLLPSIDSLIKTSLDVTRSPTVSASTLRTKIEWIRGTGAEDGGFTIVASGQLIGYIALADLTLSFDLLPLNSEDTQILIDPRAYEPYVPDFRHIVDCTPLSIQRDAPLELALELFTKLGLRYLCILDGAEFIGVIHKKSFVRFLRTLH